MSALPRDLPAFGRRLRAAMLLAEKSPSELVEEVSPDLNIGLTTVQRVMAGRRAPRPWEISRFASALGVPEWFLREGLGGSPSVSGRDHELADVAARRHDELVSRIEDLAEQVRALTARAEGDPSRL